MDQNLAEGLYCGIDIKTVSESLGHYSTAFTLDTYDHCTKEIMQQAAMKMEAHIDKLKMA